jgi:Tol biopolymer transport system component
VSKAFLALMAATSAVLLGGCSGGNTVKGHGVPAAQAEGRGELLITKWSANTDGSSAILVNTIDGTSRETGLRPSWVDASSDGSKVIVSNATDGVSIVAVDGSETSEEPVQGTEGQCSGYISVSPSGKRVLCTTEKAITLYEVDGSSGSSAKEIARPPQSDLWLESAKFVGEDGVAYVVEGPEPGFAAAGIYYADADRGGATQIASGQIGNGFDAADDGSAIVFALGRRSYNADEILKYVPQSGETFTLFRAADGGENSYVANLLFSPDGTKVAYAFWTVPQGDDGLYIMKSDGTDAQRIVSDVTPFPFVFSPDGTRIAVTVVFDEDTTAELLPSLGTYLIDVGGARAAAPKLLSAAITASSKASSQGQGIDRVMVWLP